MKANYTATIVLCLLIWGARAQTPQRIIDSSSNNYEYADYAFGNLSSAIPTHKLFNRLLIDDTSGSIVWNAGLIANSDTMQATADHTYGLLYEMRLMSFDSSTVPNKMTIFDTIYKQVGEKAFENDVFEYPLGIFDYSYNTMDIQENLSLGNIVQQDSSYLLASSNLLLKTRYAKLVAPLFDMFDSDEMAISFSKSNFYSNYRSADEILSINLQFNGTDYPMSFDQIFYFTPNNADKQKFYVEITYQDSTQLKCNFCIRTPEISEREALQEKSNSFPGCDKSDEIDINGNKLKWCMVGRCGYDGRIFKPYIIVTGYRPPIFGQTYKTTWKYYNDEHHDLLNSLRNNNYDVFFVKFNYAAKPYKHGMAESAELLEQFILYVNQQKGGVLSGQENVIQGNSMGSEIAELTLLTMEKKHFEDNSYPNHHSRLNIAYDGNFYGANLPLSYQAQIVSANYFPSLGTHIAQKIFLGTFMYGVIQQKATKELLAYHVLAPFDDAFSYRNDKIYGTPTYHWRRAGFLQQLSDVDNHKFFIPMPQYTRNIAISLGHYNLSDDQNPQFSHNFNGPGQYWRNLNLELWQFKLGAAKYMPAGETFLLFQRKKWGGLTVNHEINVSMMREIDNASGSYLKGFGNIISIANWTYFTLFNIFDGKDFFSHKSVLTALAINKNSWPSNGSMTMDIQSLGLMYNSYYGLNNQTQSNFYGYPNLGRPNDHFDITPFEAIFVGNEVEPHIRLKDATPAYIDSLNGFILNEVEPWYLGLQNQHLGSQARANYTYRSFRRAKYSIVLGKDVTPVTDKGEYVVEANAKLTLRAGKEIVFEPGFSTDWGAQMDAGIGYDECADINGLRQNNTGSKQTTPALADLEKHPQAANIAENTTQKTSIMLFPNPNKGSFTLRLADEKSSGTITISDVTGKIVFKGEARERESVLHLQLEQGMYYLLFNDNKHLETLQFIIQ